MARLLNKVAIITGAASNPGLGYASAVRFAQEGAKLVITDIDMDGLAAAEKDLVALGAEVLAMEQNVVDEDRWQEVVDAAVERFGSLDILVNNAGIALLRPISEYTTADYDLQMDVNIRSVFFGCRKALPAMIASGTTPSTPAIFSTQTTASWLALWASQGAPATSPIAYRPARLVLPN
jgi:NAD(P)-dependent dehydrogenase (short-subunit alcohol dehydrogenase family)